ncbi:MULTISPECIES: hypothetical protein [unclassified Rhizobium]|jgi:hypothetical protein|uniref:hypothetical protein n=1 Tax=unclassified Rhizobium TaxID=2613769 RepID=UPI002180D72B|nr:MULTISPECIES: hypothetical protein [unclassified Rhizobium]
MTDSQLERPGWVEILIGLATYVVLLVIFGLLMGLLPDKNPVLLGIVGSTAGGFVCLGAFALAFWFRIRTSSAFGFRPTSSRWLLIAAGTGILGYVFNLII